MKTNHPANSPVSLDRLHQIREILSKAAAQSDGGNLSYAMADAVKVIDGVIATTNIEPVACIDRANLDYLADGCDGHVWATSYAEPGDVLLYTTPITPISPDKMTVEMAYPRVQTNWHDAKNFAEGWNACLAAMLQSFGNSEQLDEVGSWNNHMNTPTAQAGNSPVTPDGWQLVPKEPTEAMNKAGWDAMNEHDAINPTYRAMLAAAPQQDVRLALEIGMSRYAGAMQKLVDSGD